MHQARLRAELNAQEGEGAPPEEIQVEIAAGTVQMQAVGPENPDLWLHCDEDDRAATFTDLLPAPKGEGWKPGFPPVALGSFWRPYRDDFVTALAEGPVAA
jgi:hypothetical protein